MPILAFIEENQGKKEEKQAFLGILTSSFPIYRYLLNDDTYQLAIEDSSTYDLIIRREGADENYLDENMRMALEEENKLKEELIEKDMVKEETSIISDFVKATSKAKEYNLTEYQEIEKLIKEFYIVDSTISIGPELFNIEALTKKDMTMEKTDGEEPQILIYHTHSQEAFIDSVQGDSETSIVGAGKRLAEILEEEYGYQVLHHTGEFDKGSRDYAYTEAAPVIEGILKDNESIEIVIDDCVIIGLTRKDLYIRALWLGFSF